MNIRTLLIAAGLATLAGGCTVTPDYDDRGYGPGYPVYRDTDAYDGYFYVQIIYIDGDPWYVDDYRRAHPIPPHLRSHFRNASWARSLPPRWGHDDNMRDGYRLSRIVYVNDAPVYVDDDRRARPLPAQVRSRFTYQEVVTPRDAGRDGGERLQPRPPRYDNAPRPLPPSSGRETMPKPPMTEERVHVTPPGRPVQPSVPDDRGAPAGRSMEKPADHGAGRDRPVLQESGRKANEGQRAGGAAEKKNGKATGRGKGRDDDGQDPGRGRDRQPGE